MPIADRLLTIDAVCQATSLGKSSVYATMMKDAAFPRPVKIGARSRWSEAKLLAWIAQKVSAAA